MKPETRLLSFVPTPKLLEISTERIKKRKQLSPFTPTDDYPEINIPNPYDFMPHFSKPLLAPTGGVLLPWEIFYKSNKDRLQNKKKDTLLVKFLDSYALPLRKEYAITHSADGRPHRQFSDHNGDWYSAIGERFYEADYGFQKKSLHERKALFDRHLKENGF